MIRRAKIFIATVIAALLAICWSSVILAQAELAAPHASHAAETSPIHISLSPHSPYIEIRKGRKIVNFDMIVQNRSAVTYKLVCIRMKVYV